MTPNFRTTAQVSVLVPVVLSELKVGRLQQELVAQQWERVVTSLYMTLEQQLFSQPTSMVVVA
jgi:hypothetical protein